MIVDPESAHVESIASGVDTFPGIIVWAHSHWIGPASHPLLGLTSSCPSYELALLAIFALPFALTATPLADPSQ